MRLTFGSLFTGVGGFDLGFERANMECLWQVEINPYCNRVLEKRWPNVGRFLDVRGVGKQNLESVDVICGGFPCPAFSTQGKGGGFEQDPLFFEMARVVRELLPTWVVFENVEGFRKWSDTLRQTVKDIGYEWVDFLLDARDFGIPQSRIRYFAVCVREGVVLSPQYLRGVRGDTGEDLRGLQPYLENSKRWGASTVGTKDGWRIILANSNRGRDDYGIPYRMDRLNALGNAVVPQMAEWIGKRIVEASECG